ncbi:TIGR04282 family arsenosugar biosynthesis glycosyltransferase [Varunaivibrio sulfuroxidans]|uniref:Glycosyltransferase n=1 Tax=Varunaivibrio sulfuroxidans TaxID=1773489 RepID=A0A4R3JFT5_9PROT|nr:TIGR04282 family arsenosugar biosynthesis glycosyltransferase [Varunaivibrio sulfuroxidans]TCS63550.1 hypothetical protein EDD55_103172 [Varunaivibrio sulfuroxidans]WES30305.1 glycosyltransferase [Varunaivibrio sulfuroxidans]
MRRSRHLVILARAPQMGQGKRRLARDIGDLQAVRFSRLILARTLRVLGRDPRWRTWLALTPDRAARDRRFWPRTVCPLAQGDGDIARRMMRPMHRLPPGPVVLIGGDIPDVSIRHIWRAFQALKRHHMAFGPAGDGGFWLFGQRRMPTIVDPFTGVRWSGPDALADTLANIPKGWTWGLCDILHDVDDGPAWRAWRARKRDG